MHGLDLEQLVIDGCITKAPCGGQVAGPSPVDRRKQGLKRSVATEADGVPLATLPAPANHRDDGLLAATLDAIGAVGCCRSGRSCSMSRRRRILPDSDFGISSMNSTARTFLWGATRSAT